MTYTKNANCWVVIAEKLSRKTLAYNLNHELNNKLGQRWKDDIYIPIHRGMINNK